MRSAFAPMLLAAALLLAACGSTSTPAGQTAPATQPSTRTAAQTVTAAPATTTAPSTTTAASSATAPSQSPSSPCRAGGLSGSFIGGQAATGHGLLGFELHNVSNRTCVSLGYPGVQFLSKAGQALPTVPTHTTQDFFGSLTDHPLAVPPGTSISFRLVVTHGAASTNGCATAYALQVIPPNDTAKLRIGIPNGFYECQTVTVSPVQRGQSAYP